MREAPTLSEPVRDLILIHGAWAAAWVWDDLLAPLRAAGFRPRAVELPGNGHGPLGDLDAGLDDYENTVLALLDTLPGPVGLVAHSGGGVTATRVAERAPERIAGVAFVAGMMLPSGTGFADITAALKADHPEAAGIVPHLLWNQARSASRVPPEAARRIFFQDLPEAAARRAAGRLTPQPEKARAAVPVWSAERFGRVPRLYVEALRDRSVVPAAQRRMQALVPGARVVSLDTGHAPQVATPAALAEVLGEFFRDPAAGPQGV